MKQKVLIIEFVTGMIIFLGRLLTYGLGVHELIPVPRPDLVVVGTTLIGILLILAVDKIVYLLKLRHLHKNR